MRAFVLPFIDSERFLFDAAPFLAGIDARLAKLAKHLRMKGTARRVRSDSSAAGDHHTYLRSAWAERRAVREQGGAGGRERLARAALVRGC